MFDQSDLNHLEPPDHLRQLPTEDVARVVAIIISDFAGAMPHTLGLELQAFAATRTIHDARRLANALRHYHRQAGLAAEVEDILPDTLTDRLARLRALLDRADALRAKAD
jgi:hypothetical protein